LAISLTEPRPETNLIQLRQDFAAGVMVGFLALPICIAAGVLTASPLGTETVAEGAMAGLYGGLVAGIVAALIGSSSFIVTCPRASPALVLATLIGSVIAEPEIAANPSLALLAAAICVFFAGIWQIVFAVFKLSTLIKFTPHAVFAGFMNGAAVVIISSQMARLIASPVHFKVYEIIFVALIALISIFYHWIAKIAKLPPFLAKVPGTMVAFGNFGLSPCQTRSPVGGSRANAR
jgi:MFS superfamily sulfate permease-like transporter